MNYKIFKLNFLNQVHFADGILDVSKITFGSDTLFSALCIESLKFEDDSFDRLIKYVNNDEVLFSNGLPYINEQLYLPKPMLRIKKDIDSGNSVLKKAYKNLKFIPLDSFNDYLAGNYDVETNSVMRDIGKNTLRVCVSIKGEEQTRPYRVGGFKFCDNCGLYVIIAYENDDSFDLITKIMESLAYSGIGGERNLGYGRFSFEIIDAPDKLRDYLTLVAPWYMTLANCLPSNAEISQIINDSRYSIIKRSGFVSSKSSNNTSRKKDLYMFASGSCFKEKFLGDIYDVSTNLVSHPVYRYAKPLFLGVNYE